MHPLLELLQRNAKLSVTELAEQLDLSADVVAAQIAIWEGDGTIMGYQAVLDPGKAAESEVDALIEVSVTPERGGGFDRVATRIARFDQVRSCYLMSGGFDLAVRIHGRSLQEVARFVSEKLSTIEGVISTRTHFQLKVYKADGMLAKLTDDEKRLAVTP
jgi:DNA-binding Lrp family transcriptional regulator